MGPTLSLSVPIGQIVNGSIMLNPMPSSYSVYIAEKSKIMLKSHYVTIHK